MRRAAVLLALLALVLQILAADCNMGFGTFYFRVLGPEAHDNLWQFASVRGWKAASSATTYTGGRNHARMVYESGYYWIQDSPCNFGYSSPDGSTVVVAAEYTSDANTVAQRAYFAVRAHVTANAAPDIPDVTMAEVPPVAAVNDAGTVTISWTEPAAQDEVVGYRVVRSADGLASWSTVDDKAVGVASATDAPGSGSFFYALEIIYQNDGTNKVVSPHGLSASVTIP